MHDHHHDHFHHPHELPAPPEVRTDREAGEVVRAWITKGNLTVSLSPMAFGDASTWGILLVDIARHVARACEQEGSGTYAQNMESIRELMEAEFTRPTDLGETQKNHPQ